MKKNISSIAIIVICTILMVGCQSYSDEYNSNSSSGQVNGLTSENNSEAAQKLDEGEFFKGSEDAKVVLVELADFECPACKNYFKEIKKFTDEYKDKIKFVYLSYPLSYHEHAMEASLAFEAAAKQGKAWDMYNTLYSIKRLSSDEIKNAAKEIGLDMTQFEADRNSQELKDKIKSHKQKGDSINLTGTPTFFLNGKQINFNPTYENLKKEVDKLLSE